MSNGLTPQREEELLADYIVQRVMGRATGRSEPECHRNWPRDVYFIGNLRPRQDSPDEDQSRPSYLDELMSKLAPVAFGAEFLLDLSEQTAQVPVTLQWSCYYRVFPSRNQQLHYTETHSEPDFAYDGDADPVPSASASGNESTPADPTAAADQDAEDILVESESPEVAESVQDRRAARSSRDRLFMRFKKIECSATGVITLSTEQGEWSANTSEIEQAVATEVARARDVVAEDPERLLTGDDPSARIRVPDDALVSDEAFALFCQSLRTSVIPDWRWEIQCEIAEWDGSCPNDCVLSIEFINASPMDCASHNVEPFVFDTRAAFQFYGCDLRPFQMDLTPRNFRYNRDAWGKGINCGILPPDDKGIFWTTHTPTFRQPRYVTKAEPPAFFCDLAQDPMPVLDEILRAMESYREIWDEAGTAYAESGPNWSPELQQRFDSDKAGFDDEIERFRRGCEFIRSDDDVRQAFRLTNETFNRGPKEAWRLFQIVFLVSQIPDIAALAGNDETALAGRETVDIVFFPTGGGKTEAYLATIVFHIFFDRLRGKAAGVTAWTRFPLRLLTLQQTQRVADVVGIAELVRQEQEDERLSGSDVDGFAVGYFVGQGGSPNEIANPANVYRATPDMTVTWSKVHDAVMRQDWKRVVRCPSCGTNSVRIDFDEDNMRLVHRCTEPDCRFPSGVIPVYIVDNEIYRYLPSVIVGTIDKLAGLGNQRKFAQMFGQVDGRCSLHGYYKGKCCQKDCSDPQRLETGSPPGISSPTLFVQDELHLLKEGLGTFDSHYETFTQELRRQFGDHAPLKMIASSATIEAFERQVEHLYGKRPDQSRVFPCCGPTLSESFYAETLDYPQRLFVGVIPHNKTIFNSILELIEYYHKEIQILRNMPGGLANPFGGSTPPSTPQWHSLIDLYVTSLTYFLANRELNSIRNDLEADVLPRFEQDTDAGIELHELTGGTSTDEVARVLDKLEQTLSSGDPQDVVLATSMVSHGVDVDRLNCMIFYGMPRQNAEYIQASSRVGRAHVGIVLNCLHPVRERDQSHYAYFVKFHDFLGQLVEPVAINRWSKFSINRTLPGLFMGVLLQLLANRYQGNPNKFYILDVIKKEIAAGNISEDDFIDVLERSYQVQAPITPAAQSFIEVIRRMVPQFVWDQIVGGGTGKTFVSEVLIPTPMRSLRDVDEPVVIELDSMGTQWAARANMQGGV